MQDLRLIGVHEDGQHLLLADADGGRYRLALDEALRAAARRDRPRLGQLQIEIDGGLRPREVQALIRSRPVRRGGRRPSGLDRREGAPLRGAGARRARARRPAAQQCAVGSRGPGPVTLARATVSERAARPRGAA